MALTISIKNGVFIENNVSVQVGDEAWFVYKQNTGSVTNSTTGSLSASGDPVKIGIITSIGSGSITVDSSVNVPDNSFLMFKKSSIANDTSLLGYYAEVKLSNNSTEKAELFALNSEITASSK